MKFWIFGKKKKVKKPKTRSNYKKLINQLQDNLKRSFSKVKKEIKINNKILEDHNKKFEDQEEFNKNILEEIALLRSKPQTLVRSKPRSSKPIARERAIKIFTKGLGDKILDTIIDLSSKGLSTSQMEEIICKKNRLCGKSSFYKYLGIVRSKPQTLLRSKPRTSK